MLICQSSEKNKEAKIVAVDLQAMSPIENVVQIQGDITSVRFKIHQFISLFTSFGEQFTVFFIYNYLHA